MYSFATCRWYNWTHLLEAINIDNNKTGVRGVVQQVRSTLRLLQKYSALRYSVHISIAIECINATTVERLAIELYISTWSWRRFTVGQTQNVNTPNSNRLLFSFCFVLLLFNGQPCNTFVNCIKHLLFVAITHKFYARVKVAIKCAIYTLIAHVRFEKITFQCDLEMGRKMANSWWRNCFTPLSSVVGGKMWQLSKLKPIQSWAQYCVIICLFLRS